ncbi:hypothetical protein TNIN_121071 [Trichonephila inaurata madagascariensis]|uniref:Uncharacterized protein n=1 Tax=Trichonephila inaurata madagascariensis TaxID=2747483 RepID=A0A8X6XJ43_9ARAC|nr:hypothetical protein TNIN_121071 [Trichonephila inaurata madagascariensis]
MTKTQPKNHSSPALTFAQWMCEKSKNRYRYLRNLEEERAEYQKKSYIQNIRNQIEIFSFGKKRLSWKNAKPSSGRRRRE